jgi:hypothetical protein
VLLEVEAAAQRVGEAASLLEDLLLHEVAVLALLRSHRVPVDGDQFLVHRRAGQVGEGRTVRSEHRHLPALQKSHAAGVAQDRRDVAGDEHLAVAVADGDAAGVAQPRGDQLARVVAAEHDDGARPVQFRERLAHRRLQIAFAAVVIVAVDQVDDHLGVGVAAEFVARALQHRAQFQKILHDAVLHHHQIAVGAGVGMGVALAGGAMRRPARMPDADAAGERRTGDGLLQVGQFARLPPHLDGVVGVDHRQPSRIIAAIFQLAQPMQNNGRRFLRADITNDATHGCFPLMS